MIKSLFAFIQIVDGKEVVVAMDMGRGPFPLYFYDEQRALQFIAPAQAMCNSMDTQINLVKFEGRRIIKSLAKDPNAKASGFIEVRDLFTKEEVDRAVALNLDHASIMKEVVEPVMPRVLKALEYDEKYDGPPMQAEFATDLLIRLADVSRR